MIKPPYKSPLQVAGAALLEVNRPDLLKYLFTVKFVTSVHFDNTVDKGYGVVDASLRIGLATKYRKYPLPCVEDLALIEKAMAISFQWADEEYQCTACERVFEMLGVSHKTILPPVNKRAFPVGLKEDARYRTGTWTPIEVPVLNSNRT